MADFKELDLLLQKYVDDGLPGCGCVVAKKGEILYENYFGWADIESQRPLAREHIFRQASLTKVAMYTMAMKLYEEGKFLMTDPLYEYFPEWKNTMKMVPRPDGEVDIVPVDKPITIKNILNMTCGLPYQAIPGLLFARHPVAAAMAKVVAEIGDENGYYTLRDQIRAMAKVPIAFEPGSRWLYGFASELTAGLLEVICGKPAELVIKEQLFEPLGMDSSANFFCGDLKERLVTNYHFDRSKKLSDPNVLFVPEVDGGLGELGTVPGFSRVMTNCWDYTKLMQMLANGGKHNGEHFMGRKTIDLMRTNTLTDEVIREDFSNNYLAGYGYGYGVRTLMDKYEGHHNGSLGAFGWTGGSGTWAEADPEEGVSIVYMHNLQPNLEEYHHLRMRAVAYGCLK